MASRIEIEARALAKHLSDRQAATSIGTIEIYLGRLSVSPTFAKLLAGLVNSVRATTVHAETDALYRQAATDRWHRDGEIEIDDNAVVSVSDERGAYVAAWVWIDDENVDGLPDSANEAA